MAADGTYEQDT